MDVVIAIAVAVGVAAGLVLFFLRGSEESASPGATNLLREVSQAFEKLLEGDPDAAFQQLSAAVKQSDAPPEVYFVLAGFLRQRGKADRSAHVLRTILAREDVHPNLAIKAKIELAGDLTRIGKLDDAQALIESLPKKQRKGLDLLALRSEAARQRGDYRSAMGMTKTLAKSDELEESPAERIAQLAEEAAGKGNLDAAAKGFHDALKADSGNIRAHLGLGDLAMLEDKPGRARRHLAAAVEANPALAPRLLGRLRKTFGDDSDDTRYAKALAGLETEGELALWVGLERVDILYAEEDLEACRSLLEALLVAHPRSLEVHEAYINLLVALDDNSTLQAHLDTFIDVVAEEMQRFCCEVCGYLGAKSFLECPRCEAVGSARYTA